MTDATRPAPAGVSDRTRSARLVAAATLAFAVASYATALISEHGFGWEPCVLCLWQRWPYLIGGALAALSFALPAQMARWALAGAAAAFLVGLGLALFHTGVEFKWWEGLAGCSAPAVNLDQPAGAALGALPGAPVARCDERTPYLLGLSMTNLNLLASAALAVGFAWAATRLSRRNA